MNVVSSNLPTLEFEAGLGSMSAESNVNGRVARAITAGIAIVIGALV
jgi:hypothetical protein